MVRTFAGSLDYDIAFTKYLYRFDIVLHVRTVLAAECENSEGAILQECSGAR